MVMRDISLFELSSNRLNDDLTLQQYRSNILRNYSWEIDRLLDKVRFVLMSSENSTLPIDLKCKMLVSIGIGGKSLTFRTVFILLGKGGNARADYRRAQSSGSKRAWKKRRSFGS